MIDLSGVPDNPGCYLFSDSKGKIIYVGKAKNLQKRVKSYFQKKGLDPKTEQLVRQIRAVDFIVTDTEVEALILENSLIKKNHPKYNIELKDAKSYAFIRMTEDAFPRLTIARLRDMKLKGEFFGPFVSAAARDHVLKVLNKTFQLRTCKRLPKKVCLRYHINLCPAPCVDYIGQEDYGERITQTRLALKGKSRELLNTMTQEMNKASEELNFERAMELRDRISAIKSLRQRQNMERRKKYNEDIVHYMVKNDTLYLVLFNVYKGTLENKQGFQLEFMAKQEDYFEKFLVQFYSENPVPKELIVPEPVSQPVIDFLTLKSERAIRIIVPQRGRKKQLLDLVLKNIEMTFFGDMEKLKDLKSKLKMQEMPVVIECFDISHISGTSTVASMVQFRNALPDKSNYRRYRIKSVEGVDDFKSIAEVVRRRYSRLKNEEAELPDLILIDGGIGQLNAATAEIKKLNVKVPTISIAKKFEEIYVPGADEPLVLSHKTKALQLLQQVRDEAHRFAITYNRLLRKKELLD
ncbi:MAG: excinuclease ABC subunit C [bacterium]|nr:excinuclease ABC subunit C [bacterium]